MRRRAVKCIVRQRKFECGLHAMRKAQIYIVRGIGMVVVQMRYQCPPEISLLELRVVE